MARIRLNPVNVHREARNKGWDAVNSVAKPTLAGAQYLAPRGSHRHGSGKGVAAQRLADTGKIRRWETPRSVHAEVVFTADWASTVALGSKAHKIPKLGRRLMGFYWARAQASPKLRRHTWRGKSFFTKVRHPGNKRPIRFLQTPLATYGRKHHFIVKLRPNSRSRLP